MIHDPALQGPSTPEEIASLRARVRAVVSLIGGKWKLEILWLLNHRMHRFNELRRSIPEVTQHMLTAQLRELERDGLVKRTIYPEVPPRVEYEITAKSKSLRPVFKAIFNLEMDRAGEVAGAGAAAKSRNRKRVAT